MDNYKSAKVSFSNVSSPLNIQSKTSKQWTPSTLEPSSYSSSFFSDGMESSSSNRFYYVNNSIKDIDNEKRKCPKPLLISFGLLLSVVTLAALAINIYLLIYINKATATSSTTSAPKACVTGDTSITFDNLTISAAVPNGYYNILWSNAYVYTETLNKSEYYTGIVSSPNIIYNGGGNSMTMTSSTSLYFSFYSAAIAAAWNDNLRLSVVGYRSNVIITNNTFTVQVFTVSYLTFTGYTALDAIVFTSYGGTQNTIANGSGLHFSMDNICLSFA